MARQEKKGRIFWVQLIAEFEASEGISHPKFCALHGVKFGTFRGWLYKLRKEKQEATTPTRFVEVEVPPEKRPSGGSAILEWGEFRLCMQEAPNPAWVAEVIARTQGGSSC